MAKHTNAWPKADANLASSAPADADATGFAPSWFVPAPPPTPPLERRRVGPAAARLWANLMGARVLVALGLLALQALAYAQGTAQPWQFMLCAGYLVATLAVLRWSRPARSDSYWSAGWALTLWVDLAVFGLLQAFQQGGVNYTPLFVLPVLVASILGPLLLALGSAAFATLALLLDVFSGEVLRPGQATASYVQSAITGAGLFLVALLANQLSVRLWREQVQARHNRARALAEAQVNQLIVTGLSEGVLVVDAQSRIWHANPAACAMLGAPGAEPPYTALQALPGWPVLASWAHHALHLGLTDSTELTLPSASGHAQRVQLRTRLTQGGEAAACVIFMEDLHDVETRVRNEKLAAMGRVSAAVAHEIRNPLAAIAQANALLVEETLTPLQQRLAGMIGQNAQRLGRTVNDILDVAQLPTRPATAHPHTASPYTVLDDTVGHTVAEWHAQHPNGPTPQWQPAAPGLQVRFDPEHLRRVLVNLMDNARKYGNGGTGAIHIATSPNGQLRVWNPGPPMPATVAQHLFEPFASSHSRSSGLGLYLSRELCQHHEAQLSYQPAAQQGVAGHAFCVIFASPAGKESMV